MGICTSSHAPSHFKLAKGRGDEERWGFVTRHTSHVTRHTSHVTRHTSHVTRHTSHVTRHTSHVTRHTSHVTRHATEIKQEQEASLGNLICKRLESIPYLPYCLRHSFDSCCRQSCRCSCLLRRGRDRGRQRRGSSDHVRVVAAGGRLRNRGHCCCSWGIIGLRGDVGVQKIAARNVHIALSFNQSVTGGSLVSTSARNDIL
jgi:hypothetical protein